MTFEVVVLTNFPCFIRHFRAGFSGPFFLLFFCPAYRLIRRCARKQSGGRHLPEREQFLPTENPDGCETAPQTPLPSNREKDKGYTCLRRSFQSLPREGWTMGRDQCNQDGSVRQPAFLQATRRPDYRE